MGAGDITAKVLAFEEFYTAEGYVLHDTSSRFKGTRVNENQRQELNG